MKRILCLAVVLALASAPALAVGGYGAVGIIGSGQDSVYVLYTGGSPYDIGYWHGSLLRAQVQHNVQSALAAYRAEYGQQTLVAAWNQMAPFVSQEFFDELQGLSDGSGVLLSDLYELHAAPDVSEYHCSAFNAFGPATANGHMLQMRNLDYGLDLGIQDNPLVIVATPTSGYRYANISFAGFIGSSAGISSQGIGVSEMGDSFDYENETLAGIPMPFLLRDIIAHAASFNEALSMIQSAARTSSYWYVVGDADAANTALFQTSPAIFQYWGPGTEPLSLPALPNVVYGGHYNDRLYDDLSTNWGNITPDVAMDISRHNAMSSNLMDAVYDLTTREIWVAYAEGQQPASSRQFAHLKLEGPDHPAAGYRTSIGTGGDEIPVVVVSGTPYEMGYQYGSLMAAEASACSAGYLSYYQTGDPVRFSNANLDAAWAAVEPYVATRLIEEMHGLADGAGISYDTVRRVHSVSLLEDFACSGVALWGAASANGHLYQIRNMDYTMDAGIQNYPCICVYCPNGGIAHANVGFAGYIGSVAGMNAHGIALTEKGASPNSDRPYNLNGIPFWAMFRDILQDASSLQDALDIVSSATRIKKYYYVIGSGDEPLGAKLRAYAPNLDIWEDNDPADELYPNVLPNVVYVTMDNAAAWNHLTANYGLYNANLMVQLSQLVASGGNLMDVVYDATARQMWVAYAEGSQRACERPYVHFDLYDYTLRVAPSSLVATAVSNTQINLSWHDNSTGETGFAIERKTGSGGTWAQIACVGANITTYQNKTGLTAKTTYYYRVRAYKVGVGFSAYSNVAYASTYVLAAPRALVAVPASNTQINLGWTQSTIGETGFAIERKTGSSGTWAQIACVGANITTYQNKTGLTAKTTYYYRVRAYKVGVGFSAYSNEAYASTYVLAAPRTLVAVPASNTQINLGWTQSTIGETGFAIERKTGSSGTWAQIACVLADITTYQNIGLTANTTYYYRVRAYKAAVGYSAYSNEAHALTPP